MPWEDPPVWIDGPFLKAQRMNIISEDLRQTAPAKAQAAGDLFYATGPNTIVRLPKGAVGSYLLQGAQAPQWGPIDPITTEGDLIVGGATGLPERLGIGSNGQVFAAVNGAVGWHSLTTPGLTMSREQITLPGTGSTSGSDYVYTPYTWTIETPGRTAVHFIPLNLSHDHGGGPNRNYPQNYTVRTLSDYTIERSLFNQYQIGDFGIEAQRSGGALIIRARTIGIPYGIAAPRIFIALVYMTNAGRGIA